MLSKVLNYSISHSVINFVLSSYSRSFHLFSFPRTQYYMSIIYQPLIFDECKLSHL